MTCFPHPSMFASRAVARQRSNFEDPVNDINRLTFIVKNDLRTVELDIDALASMAQSMQPL
jgi:hypothetical protein